MHPHKSQIIGFLTKADIHKFFIPRKNWERGLLPAPHRGGILIPIPIFIYITIYSLIDLS